jgi:anti-sigma factor RsiW
MTELSDELLVAYVDGQLAREQTRAVEKVLAQDDVIARRVAALQEAHGRLEAAFEAILASEVNETSIEPMRAVAALRASEPHRATPAKAAWVTAGVVVVIVTAAVAYVWPLTLPDLGGWRDILTPRQAEAPTPSWHVDAARAQGLLSRASLEVGLESQGNRDFIAFQLAEAIGPEVRLPNLEPQGYRFVRAQLLRNGDQPLVQLLYLPAKHDPLSLFATEGHRDSEPVFKQEGDVGTVFWCEDGIAYLLAGREDEALLYRIAEKIRHEPVAPQPEPPPPAIPAAALPPFVADAPPPGMVSEPEAPPPEAAAPGALVPSAPN